MGTETHRQGKRATQLLTGWQGVDQTGGEGFGRAGCERGLRPRDPIFTFPPAQMGLRP